MKNLHHDNIVELVDVRENATYMRNDGKKNQCSTIIMEYIEGG